MFLPILQLEPLFFSFYFAYVLASSTFYFCLTILTFALLIVFCILFIFFSAPLPMPLLTPKSSELICRKPKHTVNCLLCSNHNQ